MSSHVLNAIVVGASKRIAFRFHEGRATRNVLILLMGARRIAEARGRARPTGADSQGVTKFIWTHKKAHAHTRTHATGSKDNGEKEQMQIRECDKQARTREQTARSVTYE